MPLYDYYCPANERTLEVRHGMKEEIQTWGQLAAAAAIEPGDTPADAAVRRLIRGGSLLLGASKDTAPSAAPAASCGPGCACHSH